MPPLLLDNCVSSVKGTHNDRTGKPFTEQEAFAVCTSSLQRKGYLKKGTQELTEKGKRREAQMKKESRSSTAYLEVSKTGKEVKAALRKRIEALRKQMAGKMPSGWNEEKAWKDSLRRQIKMAQMMVTHLEDERTFQLTTWDMEEIGFLEAAETLTAALAHNSTLAKSEPGWGSVDKTKLPDGAFADRAGRRFPHHMVVGGKVGEKGRFVSGTMLLHRGGLRAALAAAGGARSGKEASAAIKSHLRGHAKAIGMGKAAAAILGGVWGVPWLPDGSWSGDDLP